MIEISDRQYEVLQLKIAGLLDKQIADRLNVSIRTVKSHAEGLCRAFGINGMLMADLIAKFGSFRVKTVWVPNPDAPKVVVKKTKIEGRKLKGQFTQSNKIWKKRGKRINQWS